SVLIFAGPYCCSGVMVFSDSSPVPLSGFSGSSGSVPSLSSVNVYPASIPSSLSQKKTRFSTGTVSHSSGLTNSFVSEFPIYLLNDLPSSFTRHSKGCSINGYLHPRCQDLDLLLLLQPFDIPDT